MRAGARAATDGLSHRPRRFRQRAWNGYRVMSFYGRCIAGRQPLWNRWHFLASDELVPYSILWFEASIGVPPETAGNEIKERLIFAFEYLLQRLRGGTASTPLRRNRKPRLAHRVEEQLLPCTFLDEVLLRRPENFHYTGQLLLLVLSRENRYACEELRQDAANTPHINWHPICHPQDDFRGPIESRLDISIDFFVLETAGSEIYDLDFGMQRMAEENVLWFQIAVYDLLLFQDSKRTQNLLGESTDDAQGKSLELVKLDELVEVHVE